MSYFCRHLILYIIILLFFLSAPVIILYAQGFRFNFRALEFTKTGTINIKTIPRGATIYLNTKKYTKQSPTKIDALKPNIYHLKVEKEGYQNWESDLWVKPELVTSATHIILLPQKMAEQEIVTGKIGGFALSADNKKIIYGIAEGKERGIWLLNLESQEKTKLADIYFDTFIWSPDNKKVLANIEEENGNKYSLINLAVDNANKPKILNLQSASQEEIREVKWQPGNSQSLFLLRGKNLYEINIENLQTNLLKDNVFSFSLSPYGILFIQETKSGFFLISQDYRFNNAPKIASPLPPRESYKIIHGTKEIAILADQDLYLIEEGLPLLIAQEANDASWSPDGKRIIYFNEHQIGEYFLKDDTQTILTRDSRILKSIEWWPRSQYVLFSVEGKMKIIDAAQEMNTHYITEIKDTGMRNPVADWSKNTKILYYLTQTDTGENTIKTIQLIEE